MAPAGPAPKAFGGNGILWQRLNSGRRAGHLMGMRPPSCEIDPFRVSEPPPDQRQGPDLGAAAGLGLSVLIWLLIGAGCLWFFRH